ncbi:MAG: hypothetical protein PHS49_03155 [Candidatus Gracilibacteria bacterium]|nr:hypothetical protein [Candidatus Gracilibacteria bacterium]
MRNTNIPELDNNDLEKIEELSKLLESSDNKGFRNMCEKIQSILIIDENLIQALIIKCKDNLRFLDILWNYVPEKYENIINDLLAISGDPILASKAKLRTNTDKYDYSIGKLSTIISENVNNTIDRPPTRFYR